jgi:heme/copper-type cytochrome/quinol oxidase subunit 2
MMAGERKIPDPTVDPTRIATALQRPILRGKAVGINNGTATNASWRVGLHSKMELHRALFWACLVITVVAELLILRAAFFPPADAVPAENMPTSPRAIEIIWAVLPAIALAAVFWIAWRGL